MSALAPAMPVLLAGRLAQGIGGGGLMALSFIAIPVMFDARLQARVMALVSTAWMISALSGPLISGLFVASPGGWRAGFWCFALQAGGLAGWLILRPSRPGPVAPVRQPGGRLSIGRLVLLATGIACVAAAGTGESDPVRAASWAVLGLSLRPPAPSRAPGARRPIGAFTSSSPWRTCATAPRPTLVCTMSC